MHGLADPARRSGAASCVVVVNYGSSELLPGNLGAVTAHSEDVLAVVVDNFTEAEERSRVASLGVRHGWKTILCEDNLGFGVGNNRAVAGLAPEVEQIVLLNPDARIDAHSLRGLVEHVRAHPTHLVAPVVRGPDGRPWSVGTDLLLATGEMRGWHRRPMDADSATYQPWLSGACLAISRSMWDRIGGFDDDYFLYWEDVDLSRRVLDAGGELRVLDDATAVHDEGGTHRKQVSLRAKSSTYYYWNARNRLVFAAKHLDRPAQRRWLLRSPGAGCRLLLQGGKRQFKDPRSTLWPVLRGNWDGWRAMRAIRRGSD